MSRQIVVTCEHGHRTEHWQPNDFDLHGTICPGGIIVDLGSLPPAAIEAADASLQRRGLTVPRVWLENAVRAALSVLVAEPQETG